MNRLYQRRLGQLPGESVLAAAIANEEDAQLVVRHCVRVVAGGVARGMLCLCRLSPSMSSSLIHSVARKIPCLRHGGGAACMPPRAASRAHHPSLQMDAYSRLRYRVHDTGFYYSIRFADTCSGAIACRVEKERFLPCTVACQCSSPAIASLPALRTRAIESCLVGSRKNGLAWRYQLLRHSQHRHAAPPATVNASEAWQQDCLAAHTRRRWVSPAVDTVHTSVPSCSFSRPGHPSRLSCILHR